MEKADITPPPAPTANGSPAPPPVPAPPAPTIGGVGAPPPVPTFRADSTQAPPAPPVSKPATAAPYVPSAPTSEPVSKPVSQHSTIPPVTRPERSRVRSVAASGSGRMSSSPLQGERTPLPNGSQVGSYIINGEIGIGGFGIVYSATNTEDGTQVAIKEHMPQGLAFRAPGNAYVHSSPETEDRFKATVGEFLEEVTVLMGISHPGIVPILTAFEANGTAYYVMPFQKGTPMSIVEQGTLDTSQQAQEARHNKRLLLSLLSTMDYLRMHQIVHRDIKPDNILITEEGNTVLLDFGSARQLQPGKVFTNVFTPDFSAPEQSHAETDEEMSKSLGPWTDLYSLGVCFYYLITHLYPPRSELRMVSSVDPYTPLAGRADLEHLYGASFLRAIDRALELKITDRWQSAAAWRIAIGEGMEPVQQKKAKKKLHAPLTLTIAALALFAGVSVWALRERALAVRAYENSLNFNARLLIDINREISDIPGTTRLQHILGEHLDTYLHSLQTPSGVERQNYLHTLSTSWHSYGDVSRQHDRLDEAVRSYKKEVEALRELQELDPDSLTYPYYLANALLGQVEVARRQDRSSERTAAHAALTEATDILQKLCRQTPHNPDFRCALGDALNEKAQLALTEGDLTTYRQTLSELQKLYRELLEEFPDHIRSREGLAYTLQYDGIQAVNEGRCEDAAPLLDESYELFTALSTQHPYRLAFKKGLSKTYYAMGHMYRELAEQTSNDKLHRKDEELALDAFRKHNAIVYYLESQAENSLEHSYDICRSLSYMVDILLHLGQGNLAEAHCKTISRKLEKLMNADPDNEDYLLMAARTRRNLATLHSLSPYYEREVTKDYRIFRELAEKLYHNLPDDENMQQLYMDSLVSSAAFAVSIGKAEQAIGWVRQAHRLLKEVKTMDKELTDRLDQITTRLQKDVQTPVFPANEAASPAAEK